MRAESCPLFCVWLLGSILFDAALYRILPIMQMLEVLISRPYMRFPIGSCSVQIQLFSNEDAFVEYILLSIGTSHRLNGLTVEERDGYALESLLSYRIFSTDECNLCMMFAWYVHL